MIFDVHRQALVRADRGSAPWAPPSSRARRRAPAGSRSADGSPHASGRRSSTRFARGATDAPARLGRRPEIAFLAVAFEAHDAFRGDASRPFALGGRARRCRATPATDAQLGLGRGAPSNGAPAPALRAAPPLSRLCFSSAARSMIFAERGASPSSAVRLGDFLGLLRALIFSLDARASDLRDTYP